MTPLPHRVRRWSFQVRAPSSRDALALRTLLHDRMDAMLSAAARAFDAADAPGAIAHVPRLVVRARIASIEQVDTLARCIEQELDRHLASLFGRAGAAPVAYGLDLPACERAGRSALAAQAPQISLMARTELLQQYLTTGSLPWPLANLDTAVTLSELRDAAENVAAWPALIAAQPVVADARVAFWSRWLQLLPEASWPNLVRAAAGSGEPSVRLVEAVSAVSREPQTGYPRLARAATAIAAAWNANTSAARAKIPSLAPPLPAPAAVVLRDRLAEEPYLTDRSGLAVDRREPREHASAGADMTAFEEQHSELPESALADASLRAAPSGHMVHHAGLVILYPFLPRLFEATGVKAAGQPALRGDQLARAAALLHLLATGQPEPFELELGFIKLLLGLPRAAALPVSEGLVAGSDREEVDGLLAAVIDHWRALRRTSVQGLRATFLQRRGLVRDDDHGVRLQIELAPFDVLLGQLPWGITIVKLPWMTRPIFTEWPAP